MRRFFGLAISICGLGIGALLGGCDSAKEQAVDRALEGTDIELEGLGGNIPESFPEEVPLPAAEADLETAIGTGDVYTMRYAISDPQSATDSYRDALVAAGFTIELEFNNLEESSNNVGFTATNGSRSVTSASFGPDPTDGLYQAVVVQPEG